MITCPTCGERVPYALLRVDYPRCSNGHELGMWVVCGGKGEKHVYLRAGDGKCPYCGSREYNRIDAGTPVRCMHQTENGQGCLYPRYRWMIDGPPCHLNHLTKIVLDME